MDGFALVRFYSFGVSVRILFPDNSLSVSNPISIEELIGTVNALKADLIACNVGEPARGFPLPVHLPDGRSLRLDFSQPGPLAAMHPEHVGFVLLNSLGEVTATWGLADRLPHLAKGTNLIAGILAPSLQAAFEGRPTVEYIDGYRYFACPGKRGEPWLLLLVTNAHEERTAKLEAAHHERIGSVLSTLGTRLSMNQNVQLLSVAAAHEICSAADLAAVLIWLRNADRPGYSLKAHVGVNRHGTQTLQFIEDGGHATCIAELVAGSKQHYHHDSVYDNVLTNSLEAKICYLQPGGVSVHPLITGDRVLGVIEVIGREGDEAFPHQLGLFKTVAEHLALALNGAMMYENLERLATHDPLTGIANHRTMQEFLHNRVSEAKRTKEEIGVIMIDVDHFRTFNEEEGHEAGDTALKAVAEALSQSLRSYDLAARYGGEEFTVILPGSGPEATITAAERIRTAIEALRVQVPSGNSRRVTASIGCAVFPYSAQDPTAILRAADNALYEAKRCGRNRVATHQNIAPQPPASALDLEQLRRWLDPEEEQNASGLVDKIERPLAALSEVYRLSPLQRDIIRGAVLISSAYLHGASRTRIESDPAARPLLPALKGLQERFDGTGPLNMKGPRIPLLGRISAALIALGTNNSFDEGQLDPQIVSVLIELDSAA